jgi:hypothetical protein
MDHIVEWIAAKSKTVKPEDMHCVVAGVDSLVWKWSEQLN